MFRERDKWRVAWREQGQRRSMVFENPNDARLFEAQLKSGVINVKLQEVQTLTFSQYADRWFREYAQIEKSESTWENDLTAIKRHLNPVIGELKLVALTKAHGLRLKVELSKKSLKPKTINNILQLAKKMMACAVDFELIEVNPFQNVRPLKAPKPGFRFWNSDECEKFLKVAFVLKPEFAELVKVALHTGLRTGELRALTRKELDFCNSLIRVNSTHNKRLGKVLNRSKNGEVDFVPMNSSVLTILSTRKLMKADQLIFRSSLFENTRRDLKNLCIKANVPVLSFHGLRHTFASCLAMASVDLMVIQKLLRHKSYEMTLRYAHLHPNSLKGVTEVLVNADPQMTRSGRKAEETELVGF